MHRRVNSLLVASPWFPVVTANSGAITAATMTMPGNICTQSSHEVVNPHRSDRLLVTHSSGPPALGIIPANSPDIRAMGNANSSVATSM